MSYRIRLIAFYLPQFHPTSDNDKWWGKGYTEWTNVGKAKPLFPGHYQPKVPADLGYYDLRLPATREMQAEMAREAGVEGFCYYHYWFGNGKQELELPFNEVLSSDRPDFPFCLCWANESWHSKSWNKDGVSDKKLLIEQQYLGDDDYIAHFNKLLPAFQDKRYIKVDNLPLFMIYQPLAFADVAHFIELWNSLALKNGLKGIYFCGQTNRVEEIPLIFEKGFKALNLSRLFSNLENLSLVKRVISKCFRMVFSLPQIMSYKYFIENLIGKEEMREDIMPTIIPNWDHSPRSGRNGLILKGNNPDLFDKHIKDVLYVLKNKPENKRIAFLKSWNEWGEGNYMEPDLKFGRKYIDTLKKNLGQL